MVVLHQRRLHAARQGLGQKTMAIKPLPHQGNKQLTTCKPAAIGADRPHGNAGIQPPALGSLGGTPACDQIAKLHQIKAWVTR